MKTKFFITNGLTHFITIGFGISSHNIDNETEARKDAFGFDSRDRAEIERKKLQSMYSMRNTNLQVVEKTY